MPNPPDLFLLLDRARRGDEQAFRQVYERTKNRVYTLALSYVRTREEAEEITQDVFVEAFHAAETFRHEAAVTTWLYRITVNKSLDFLKHKKRQKRFAFLTSLFEPTTGEALAQSTDFFHPGIALENQEAAAVLFRAIDRLPEKQKTAYLLTNVEGLSNIATAEVMASSVGAVESLLQRANENLRKHLAGFYKTLYRP